jgi:hypothetical protein
MTPQIGLAWAMRSSEAALKYSLWISNAFSGDLMALGTVGR